MPKQITPISAPQVALLAKMQLSHRELAILWLYAKFGTGPKVAETVGLSKQRAHQILASALKKVAWQQGDRSVEELLGDAKSGGVDKELW